MMPWSSIVVHWCSGSSLFAAGYQYSRTANGAAPGTRWMRWSLERGGGMPCGVAKMGSNSPRTAWSRFSKSLTATKGSAARPSPTS
jgi:hypothetical protein